MKTFNVQRSTFNVQRRTVFSAFDVGRWALGVGSFLLLALCAQAVAPIKDAKLSGTASQIASGTFTIQTGVTFTAASGSTVNLSAGTLTLATGQVAWDRVSKTSSSLADLATRSAGDLTSGTVAVARLPALVGDSGSGGTAGLAPAPATGDATKFLRGDATWAAAGSGAAAAYVATGTGGAGYLELPNQSSAPGTPTTATRFYVDSANRFAWKGTNGFARIFDGTANTADRTYTLPNASGEIVVGGNSATTSVRSAASVVVDNTGKATGFQIYNTADETTNYERLEGFWTGNSAVVRTVFGGSGLPRILILSATNTAGGFNSNALTFRTGGSTGGQFAFAGTTNSIVGNIGASFTLPMTQASGTTVGVSILPTYTQTSTAAATDFLINRTQTSVGSGAQLLIAAQVGGVNKWTLDNTGVVSQASNFLQPASAYHNFGTLVGTTGYGLRDNAGTIELKNSSGAWVAPSSPSSTDTLTNKTLDASATGNTIKLKGYLYLTHPHLADGTGATLGTTATALAYGHATFSNSADQAANYVEYRLQVPTDIDTAVEWRAKLKVNLTGADTATQRYVLSTVSQADSASATGTPGTPINLDFAGDASGASGDVETVGYTTLTGWAATMTADRLLVIRLARDGDDAADASTVNSTELGLVLEYGITQ